MSVKKTYYKTKPYCKVTFRLKKRTYQYRFVIDDKRWVTDKDADEQVYCDFAQGQNAVVVV
ncbi:MAG: hypothetical protein P8X96_12955 [Desulfobacteraceae bacterium]